MRLAAQKSPPAAVGGFREAGTLVPNFLREPRTPLPVVRHTVLENLHILLVEEGELQYRAWGKGRKKSNRM